MSITGASHKGHALSPLASELLAFISETQTHAHTLIGHFCRVRGRPDVDVRRAVLELLRADAISIGDGWAITPVEPEPDHAVTTYGELSERGGGARFQWLDLELDEGVCTLNGLGWTNEDGDLYQNKDQDRGDEPVRTLTRPEVAEYILHDVSASVVVHEEPGTHARDVSDGVSIHPYGGHPGYRIRVGYGDARRLRDQLAAVFAKRGSSSENKLKPCVACGSTAEGSDGNCGPHNKSLKVEGPEPTEDRSEPAPGWETGRLGVKGQWVATTAHGGHFYPREQSEAGSIAHSWVLHDAGQARKAGEL